MVKWVTIALALIGLAMGIYTVATARREIPNPPPAQPPSVNPYASGIAATGIVEASSRNISIAAPEQGLVTQVLVDVNDQVTKGQPLFKLDARALEAELVKARAAVDVAQAQLYRLEKAPRPEDIAAQEASVSAAEAQLAYAKNQYDQTQAVFKRGAATREELDRREAQYIEARSRLEEARAVLSRLRAGTWEQDLAVARQQLEAAGADAEALEVRIARMTVTSPIDGTVFKRNIQPGEYAAPGMQDTPSLVLGSLVPLHVRAQVDEEDVVRLRQGADAIARVRGPIDARVPLRMLRIEPWAQPKTQLTGVPTELVETRVIEVVFEVNQQGQIPIYPGMLVDVFISAETADSGGPQPDVNPGGGKNAASSSRK